MYDRSKSLNVAVVGAGIAGLAAALAFARAGHRVVLLEKDAAPPPATPGASFLDWDRPGVPQRRLVHGFLPLARKRLLEHLPDAVDLAVAAGAHHVDLLEPVAGRQPRPGDEDLVVLRSRRTVFEWVLRRMAGTARGLTVSAGDPVVGLLGSAGRVSGVRTQSGARLDADLVVDASGRRSRVADWLVELGAQPPDEERDSTQLIYFSRFYVLPGDRLPVAARVSLGYATVTAVAGDGRTFCITFFARAEEPGLRRLRDAEAFERAVAALPGLESWRLGATPLGPVNAMGALENTIRRFAPDGRPLVAGLIPIGDSLSHTNPTLGRGMSLGLDHAFTAASLPWRRNSLATVAAGYHSRVDPMAEASFADAVEATRLSQRLYAGDRSAAEEPRGVVARALPLAAAHDQDLFRAGLRNNGLLEPPGSLVREPWIGRARAVLALPEAERRSGPDLQDFLRILEGG